jgi:hypothetical protein
MQEPALIYLVFPVPRRKCPLQEMCETQLNGPEDVKRVIDVAQKLRGKRVMY